MSTLELRGISCPLAEFALELDAHLTARVTGIFGPSGSGKTSLLDVIAGLRRLRGGSVILGGRVLEDAISRIWMPARERRVGYVPQDLALFPHLSVRQNVLYGARHQVSEDSPFALPHVAEVLEIAPLLSRSVAQLSGGERQRVALARALLSAPRLLLLDEPLSSLDSRLKSRALPLFQRIRDEFRVPMLYVSHAADEVRALCDEVLLLERGRVVARGAPAEVLAET